MSHAKPFLGAVVLYKTADATELSNGTDVHPAIVNRVWNDECVSLTVFPDCGAPFTATSVTHSASLGLSRSWDWPQAEG